MHLDRRRFLRMVALITVAWLPAMAALVAGAPSAFGVGTMVGLAGWLVAVGIAVWLTRARSAPRLRADAPRPAGSWADIADPRANHLVRWSMYGDLSEWLRAHDWSASRVVEFGGSNGLLTAFIEGAAVEHLAYPPHDIQDLRAVASGQYDLALLDQTLEHVADPERGMREIHRILKPGGVAVVTTPFLIPVHTADGYGDYTRWTPQGMQTMLERTGFRADVRCWGSERAAIQALEDMYVYADQASALGVDTTLDSVDATFPVTVWAIATARADWPGDGTDGGALSSSG